MAWPNGTTLALALTGLTLASCEGSPMLPPPPPPPPPLVRTAFLPDVQYRAWWDDLQACAFVQGDLDRVRFFEVSSPVFIEGQQFPCGDGFFCNGIWERPHDISIAPAFLRTERLVKHEMLHDLLDEIAHPEEFAACNAEWTFDDRTRRVP